MPLPRPPTGPGIPRTSSVVRQGLGLAESTGYAYPNLKSATGTFGNLNTNFVPSISRNQETNDLVHSYYAAGATIYKRVTNVNPSFTTAIYGKTGRVNAGTADTTAGYVNLNFLSSSGTSV